MQHSGCVVWFNSVGFLKCTTLLLLFSYNVQKPLDKEKPILSGGMRKSAQLELLCNMLWAVSYFVHWWSMAWPRQAVQRHIALRHTEQYCTTTRSSRWQNTAQTNTIERPHTTTHMTQCTTPQHSQTSTAAQTEGGAMCNACGASRYSKIPHQFVMCAMLKHSGKRLWAVWWGSWVTGLNKANIIGIHNGHQSVCNGQNCSAPHDIL